MTARALTLVLALLSGPAWAHSEREEVRGPVAYALAVSGPITRQDGTWLDAGEAVENGARLTLPGGASATMAQNGRIERWEGPGTVLVNAVAARLNVAGTSVRRPHVEERGNALTGDVRAPAGAGQVMSALGVPLTEAAWASQRAIDGGQLHALYRDVLNDRLAAAGVDRAVVEKLGLLDALPGDGSEQVALIGRYLDLAGATPDAAVVFEVPPTDTSLDSVRRYFGATLLDGVRGEAPHTFRVTRALDAVRTYGRTVADSLRRRGHTVFGVVVPYANTVENIVLRNGKPDDGVAALHALLARAGGYDAPMPTVALGYSQGGAVVRDYVARYGDSDGLDYALPLATMGGADGAGGDGVWSGRRGELRGKGVTVLSAVHAEDPARRVFGAGFFALAPRLADYARGGPEAGDVAIHADFHGSNTSPVPTGTDPAAARGIGTHGYPTSLVGALCDALFAGEHAAAWARRGDWAWDQRRDLPARAGGDFRTWVRDPWVIAGEYRPVGAGPVAPEPAPPAAPAASPAAPPTP